MKTVLLLTFLLSLSAFSQVTIEKADGTKLNVDSVTFDAAGEKMTYKIGKEKEKLKYKEVKSVIDPYKENSKFPLANYTWRYFPKAKKFKGMYIKAETDTKILAFVHYTLEAGGGTSSVNGVSFTSGSSSFEHVHLTVFDKEGTVIEDADLRSGPQKHNVEDRGAAVEIIKKHFADCPAFINGFNSYLTADEDPKNLRVVTYFMQMEFITINDIRHPMELHNFVSCN